MHKIFPALMLSIIAVSASAGQPFIEVFDRAVKKECGSCHMVFNPEMLPAKSWETIMKGLKNHFGKEVGLDEATVGKIGEEEIYYLMSSGLNEEEATKMVVSGFIEPVIKSLPLEYAVELNKLIELEMKGLG